MIRSKAIYVFRLFSLKMFATDETGHSSLDIETAFWVGDTGFQCDDHGRIIDRLFTIASRRHPSNFKSESIYDHRISVKPIHIKLRFTCTFLSFFRCTRLESDPAFRF